MVQPALGGERDRDWALWQLSLILAEVARQEPNTESGNPHSRLQGVTSLDSGEKGEGSYKNHEVG